MAEAVADKLEELAGKAVCAWCARERSRPRRERARDAHHLLRSLAKPIPLLRAVDDELSLDFGKKTKSARIKDVVLEVRAGRASAKRARAAISRCCAPPATF